MTTSRSKFKDNLRIILSIAAKDIIDAIKNKTTLAIMLGVALLMLSGMAMPLIMGFVDIPTAYYYDPGKSSLIRQLVKQEQMRLRPVESQQDLENTIGEAADVVIGLVIPDNFDQLADSNEPIDIIGMVSYWANPSKVEERVSFFESQFAGMTGGVVKINLDEQRVYPTSDSDGQPFMIAFSFSIVVLTIGIILAPYLISEEKETHTIDALLISPASYTQIIIGKALAGLFYCMIAAIIVFAFNLKMFAHWEIAILAAILGALFAVSIGLLLGILFDTPASMNLWFGVIIILLLAPIYLERSANLNWPVFIEIIIPWLPSVALSKLIQTSFTGVFPIGQVMLYTGILIVSAVFVYTLVIWQMRKLNR
jgi:ABC-2 type transport system permease protein